MMLNTKRPASLLDITTGLVGVAYNPVVTYAFICKQCDEVSKEAYKVYNTVYFSLRHPVEVYNEMF